MCLSNNLDESASFTSTILYGAEWWTPNGWLEHVCGYYNNVQSEEEPVISAGAWRDAGRSPWDFTPAGHANAMLLAIPAMPGTLSEASLVPMSKFSHIMEDYATAVKPPVNRAQNDTWSSANLELAPVVIKGFDEGVYDVVIAHSARSIADVLPQVDKAKRPEPNPELYRQLDAIYPGFTFLLFCFTASSMQSAGCAMVSYRPFPQYEHMLFLPALDGHLGRISQQEVSVDHTVVLASQWMNANAPEVKRVVFTDDGTDGVPFFFDKVIGRTMKRYVPQGDFIFNIQDLRAGQLRTYRQTPPAWKSLFRETVQYPWLVA